MIASDGGVAIPGSSADEKFSSDHPRSTGTFPRVLGKYVREQRILTIEQAVRKATSAPADFLKLPQRGRIMPGYTADLTIFDPQLIGDRSTWKRPRALAVGVVSVLVNGQFGLRDGVLTGIAAGRFVRRAEPALPLGPKPNH
jgi:N-acyl-D-aspartate/D-glutamate deacylase